MKLLKHNWAYARAYRSSAERSATLPGFVYRYNHIRPHSGLDGATPIARLTSSTT